MATTKELKNRINSVKDTQKITNAMYLISSTKMRKAKKELELTRPFFDMLKRQLVSMVNISENVRSKFIRKTDEPARNGKKVGTPGYLVVTADKGLAGPYNQNVIKKAMALIKKSDDYKLFVVGEYGRHFFEAHGLEIEESFLYTAQNPTLRRAREITTLLLDTFVRGEISKIFVVYTDFTNGLSGGVPTFTELVPFDRSEFAISDLSEAAFDPMQFEYEPDIETVIDNIIPSYVTGYIYGVLVNSFCSEQNARMLAMDSANKNAEELLDFLNLQYNHVRQSAITQEITEVTAGSRGQKEQQKKKKREENL